MAEADTGGSKRNHYQGAPNQAHMAASLGSLDSPSQVAPDTAHERASISLHWIPTQVDPQLIYLVGGLSWYKSPSEAVSTLHTSLSTAIMADPQSQ